MGCDLVLKERTAQDIKDYEKSYQNPQLGRPKIHINTLAEGPCVYINAVTVDDFIDNEIIFYFLNDFFSHGTPLEGLFIQFQVNGVNYKQGVLRYFPGGQFLDPWYSIIFNLEENLNEIDVGNTLDELEVVAETVNEAQLEVLKEMLEQWIVPNRGVFVLILSLNSAELKKISEDSEMMDLLVDALDDSVFWFQEEVEIFAKILTKLPFSHEEKINYLNKGFSRIKYHFFRQMLLSTEAGTELAHRCDHYYLPEDMVYLPFFKKGKEEVLEKSLKTRDYLDEKSNYPAKTKEKQDKYDKLRKGPSEKDYNELVNKQFLFNGKLYELIYQYQWEQMDDLQSREIFGEELVRKEPYSDEYFENKRKEIIALLPAKYHGDFDAFEKDYNEGKELMLDTFRSLALQTAFESLDATEELVTSKDIALDGEKEIIKTLRNYSSSFEKVHELESNYDKVVQNESDKDWYNRRRTYRKRIGLIKSYLEEEIKRKHPILNRKELDVYKLYRVYVKKDQRLTIFRKAKEGDLQKLILEVAGDVLFDVRETRQNIIDDPDLVWKFENLIGNTLTKTNVFSNDIYFNTIKEHFDFLDKKDKEFKMMLGALAIGLSLLAPGTTGIVLFLAATGAGGLGVYDAVLTYQEYDVFSSASGAYVMDDNKLTSKDPALIWVILAAAGVIADIHALKVFFAELKLLKTGNFLDFAALNKKLPEMDFVKYISKQQLLSLQRKLNNADALRKFISRKLWTDFKGVLSLDEFSDNFRYFFSKLMNDMGQGALGVRYNNLEVAIVDQGSSFDAARHFTPDMERDFAHFAMSTTRQKHAKSMVKIYGGVRDNMELAAKEFSDTLDFFSATKTGKNATFNLQRKIAKSFFTKDELSKILDFVSELESIKRNLKSLTFDHCADILNAVADSKHLDLEIVAKVASEPSISTNVWNNLAKKFRNSAKHLDNASLEFMYKVYPGLDPSYKGVINGLLEAEGSRFKDFARRAAWYKQGIYSELSWQEVVRKTYRNEGGGEKYWEEISSEKVLEEILDRGQADRIIGDYSIDMISNKVGDKYIVNGFNINLVGGAKESVMGIREVMKTLELEAINSGAKVFVFRLHAIKNERFLSPRLWQLAGYTFKNEGGAIILVSKLIS